MNKQIDYKWKEVRVKPFFKNFVKKHKRLIFYAATTLLIIILLIPVFTYIYFARDLKNKESIINRGKTGLTLLTRDGEPFFRFYQPKEIEYIPISEIPESVQQAVIATEDKNFYTNPGFSIRGIARAFMVNLFAGRVVEGGSTITQELAKNAFLSQNRTFLRKYQELVLAIELNRRFSKEDVLEMYLNSVYFGEGAFGIENAAQAYFGKSASDLTLSESALLVGVLPAPSAYSPLSNDDQAALRRQNVVLSEMVEDEYITTEEKENAAAAELAYNPTPIENGNTLAPHFAIFVKNELIEKYGEERVISDGFNVRTTLNGDWQEYAEEIVNNQVSSLKANNASNGAAIAIDPKNGEIAVMVGSMDWSNEQFGKTNMTIIPRQPGSSFKPIVYADALEQEIVTPATILNDNPTTFPGNYKPKNYDLSYRGPVTVRRALANSLNIPSVEVMEKVGVSDSLKLAKKLRISTLGQDASQYGLSLVLGTGEIKLLELTNAYAAFANKGVSNQTKSVIEIKDKYGKTVDSNGGFFSNFNIFNVFKPSTSQKAVSEEVAFLISSILSDNRTRSEEFGGSLTISRPAAVKTGTTEDYRDALTVGYTPSLAVGVWVGNNDNSTMDNVAGSLGAAPIWRSLMQNFLAQTPAENFEKPTFVVEQTVCISRSLTYKEFFISGTQPPPCDRPSPTFSPTPTLRLSPSPTEPDEEEENEEEDEENIEPTEQPTPTPTPTPIAIPTAVVPT